VDASVAQQASRYRVNVEGVERQILSARVSNAGRTVTLLLAGSVSPEAGVQVRWSGLFDTSRRVLRDGTMSMTTG
jgi:hypothetical protein